MRIPCTRGVEVTGLMAGGGNKTPPLTICAMKGLVARQRSGRGRSWQAEKNLSVRDGGVGGKAEEWWVHWHSQVW